MLVLTLHHLLPYLPEDLAEYFFSDATVVAVLGVNAYDFRKREKHVFKSDIFV